MSIENNLQRIADSLEIIAQYIVTQPDHAPVEAPAAPAPAPAPVVEAPAPAPAAPAPAPAPTPVVEAPAAPAPAPAPAPAAPSITVDELNTALVAEFHRLGGNREPIDTVLRNHGVQSVKDLPVEQYESVLAAVRAITA